MKATVLALAALGLISLWNTPAMAQWGPVAGRPYQQFQHRLFHQDLAHNQYHRELDHRDAHRYPLTWQQHGRLHDALDHDAFHDRLAHREFHRQSHHGHHLGGFPSGGAFAGSAQGGNSWYWLSQQAGQGNVRWSTVNKMMYGHR